MHQLSIHLHFLIHFTPLIIQWIQSLKTLLESQTPLARVSHRVFFTFAVSDFSLSFWSLFFWIFLSFCALLGEVFDYDCGIIVICHFWQVWSWIFTEINLFIITIWNLEIRFLFLPLLLLLSFFAFTITTMQNKLLWICIIQPITINCFRINLRNFSITITPPSI